jgi:hypothetical protein
MRATAKAGLGLAESMAQKLGLWSQCRRKVAGRRDPNQGFETTAVIASVVHGLLSGGKGFRSTEALRGDEPLLKLVGLSAAPSAETVEEVTKYLGGHTDGHTGLSETLIGLCHRLLALEQRRDVLDRDGWFNVWADGTVLEVEGRCFEGKKYIDGKWGQLFVGCFAGPYIAACDFAGAGEGEQALVHRFVPEVMRDVVRPMGLAKQALLLLDSLHGDGPMLDCLESESMSGTHYIVGANKLSRVKVELADMPEFAWQSVKSNPSTGRHDEAVCEFWLQCEEWSAKRLCVGRRWKNKDEMIWNYSGVITSLRRDHPRVAARMAREKLSFAETIWQLYDHKQAMENQWKDMLADMGLHHPPSRKPADNAIFYAMGALALNLSVGLRRLAMEGEDRFMRLWRLRREIFDVAGSVMLHARRAWLTLLDARDWVLIKIEQAAARLARL